MSDEKTPILAADPEPKGFKKFFLVYLRPGLAECTALFIFVWVGVMASSINNIVAVALAHGFTIVVMVANFAGISGGHVNPAVTLGVTLAGGCNVFVGLFYLVCQLVGSVLGAAFAKVCLSDTVYNNILGGTPQLGTGVSAFSGTLIEAITTFILVMTAIMTAVEQGTPIAPLAIGFAVLVDIFAAGPLTGAAMNPARSFGPAVVSGIWDNEWVYWVGPIIGALTAGIMHRFFFAGGEKRLLFKSKED